MNRMKIVGIVSSANPNGNSATLLREALAGAAEAGAEVEEIDLAGMRLEFCRGCFGCLRRGRCGLDDDFASVRARLAAADGIILSSPTYAAAPCARMKNLIDRLGMFEYLTASLFDGKYVAAIATAKSFGADKTARALTNTAARGIFGRGYVVGRLGILLRGGKSASGMPKALRRARVLGGKMVADFERGRTYRWQGWPSRMMSGLLMRPMMAKGIVRFKDTDMRGVYAELHGRGLIV